MNNKGQTSLIVALVGAGSRIIVSIFTSWATSSQNISDVERQVSIVEERENLHYQEVEKRLINIENKLNQLLSK